MFAPDAIDYFVMILGYANVIHGVVGSITFSSIYYMYTYCSCCFHFCWTAAVATIATTKKCLLIHNTSMDTSVFYY